MRKWIQGITLAGALMLLAHPAGAQDYRARVQGTIVDPSQGALPGATVTLINTATGVEATRVSDTNGRYVFDFVDPGTYKMRAELDGFRGAQQENVRVMQRGNVEVGMTLELGTIAEMITVTAPPVSVQFHNSSTQLTVESQIIDQAPVAGRNPYNLSTLDPSVLVSATTNENRPYHHAFANDYDAGGGTRRANDVLLDGVPLGASYKTSYTPAMDAVEEVTVSKNSVDAENGNSLGGIISLNMKAGTNQLRGSAYSYFRDPSMNARTDPTLAVTPGVEPLKGSELQMYGGTVGAPLVKNKVFSFTSYENWNDSRPLSIVRTVPTELERRGDFSQSQQSGAVRTIYNPFTSTLDAAGRVVRTPFAGNVIPSNMLDPVAQLMLQQLPLPNLSGNVDNLQYTVAEKVNYWNFSQRVDVNFNDNFKIFGRIGVFKADLYQDNPIGSNAGFFPLSGSNRDGMSTAGDAVWIMSNKTTLNVRGSYYNMVDEFYNPSLLLGADGLANYWPNGWYAPLYNSGYAYYPALDVTSGTTTNNTTNRLGRQGREWYQHPDAWTMSARMNRYEGAHNMKWGGEVRTLLRLGSAVRADQPRLQFGADRQQLGCAAGGHDRQPVGVVHARRPRQPDVRAPRPAADGEHRHLFQLLPGRLGGERSTHAQPGASLGVRARRLRPGEPDVAEARPDAADPGDAGDTAEHAGLRRAVDGEQGLQLGLQRRMAVHDPGEPIGVEHDLEELPAAVWRQLPPPGQLGPPLRLCALPDAAQQPARHPRRLRPAVHRLRADDQHPGAVRRTPAAGVEQSLPRHQPGAGGSGADARPLHRPRQRRQLRSVCHPAAGE